MDRKPIIGITMDTRETESGLYQYINRNYIDAVVMAGGMSLALPIPGNEESIKELAKAIDGLILSGGGDIHPSYYNEEVITKLSLTTHDRTDFEFSILRAVMELKKPVLGICYGMQLINVALGGSLYQDIKKQAPKSRDHRKNHPVKILPGSILRNIMDGVDVIDVISTHHQSIKDIGRGLTVSAEAEDGIIEAVEMEGYPFLIGVQWHPEKEIGDLFTRRLMFSFIKACRGMNHLVHTREIKNE